MRIKIAYKLLLANLSIILLLVLAMQVMSYFSNKEVLIDFISDIEGQVLDDIIDKVASEYAIKHSWDDFIADPKLWRRMIVRQIKDSSPISKMGHRLPGFGDRPPRPGPPPFFDENKRRGPPKHFDKNISEMIALDFLSRLSLLDADHQEVIAARTTDEVLSIKEIVLNNETIGWLKLNKKHIGDDPFADFYLKKRLKVIYLVGAIGVIIATFISYFLSRHITAPITLLTDTAKNIAKRDFTTRIKVKTNDEFRDLANSVNNISKELAKYDDQQKQWLMDISHELRTPLTILDGEIEALLDGITPLDEQAVTSLQEEVTLIMRLVNDLHDLTVIDKTSFECQQENINFTQLLNLQLNKFSNKFNDSNIVLNNQLLAADIFVLGDQARLCQVVKNIFENGLRYIDSPGSLTVTTSITKQKVQLTFQDSGPGVSQEALPQLFNRLYRTDDSRNRKTGGAGLGLAICKNIIEAHRGDISAEKNIEGGLSIHIHLPINDEI